MDDGDVLGFKALSIAERTIFKQHVEYPMHGLDAPAVAEGGGDAVDVRG